MQTESTYEKDARELLESFGLEFRTVLVGDDCPSFCEDAKAERDMDQVNVFPRRTHIHGKHYRCTFSGRGRGHLGIDFWNSYADEEWNFLIAHHNDRLQLPFQVYKQRGLAKSYDRMIIGQKKITPKPYDVLTCIQKNDPGTFHDFCGDFDYDEDSRQAFDAYNAVVYEWQKVRKFFTDAELEKLQHIA